MDNLQYMQAFLDESVENTQTLNDICLRMEQESPSDDDFATMFRAAHTLKGMSATMGFSKMARLTHRLEDAMGYLRSHPEQMSSDIVDVLFATIDALDASLKAIRDVGQESDEEHGSLLAQLEAIVEGKGVGNVHGEVAVALAGKAGTVSPPADLRVDDTALALVVECENQGLAVGVITVSLDPQCQMKGPRAIMVSRALDEYGHTLYCQPSPDVLESGTFSENNMYFVVALDGDVNNCVRAVSNISEVMSAVFTAWSDWVEGAAAGEALDQAPDPAAPTVPAAQSARQAGKTERTDKVDRTIRVPVDRLDTLMNLLSELVIDKTRLGSIAAELERTELKDLTDHISRISNDLQSSVMSLRMVPVDSLFQRFPRMVRDLSKSLGKDIALEMSGLETEFDRTVIDEMGEALVHLIRNSADHGLESTADRVAHGKPAAGTIALRAYSSGQSVFIEVSDDGAGIDVERVRARAVDKGIIDVTAAANLSPKQVYELLFASGFSTAETVSDISGRGVGLDAVRRKVESLGGRIDIESERGVGSTFRLQLPLTLSILQALLVTVAGDVYAIPLGSVEEVVLAGQEDLTTVHGQTVLSHGDKLVPIVDMRHWWYGEVGLGAHPWRMVVCKEGAKRVAMAIDTYIGQQEIVHKPLGQYLKRVRGFSGATILGDGGIGLIVDVHALLTELG